MRNTYRQLVAIFFLGVVSQWALASQLTSLTTGAKIVVGDSVDVLIPAASNNGLVSYSKFNSFAVDRPLKILNTSDSHGLNTKVAKLIVIQADNIDLRSGIELIGEVADILLISNNQNYNFNCYSCSFNSFGRVTLAIANPVFDVNYVPGDLNLLSQGVLNINGLNATHVASFEAIAKNIIVDGQVNTQLKGSYISDGSYQLNPNGSLVIGAGGVNIFAGFNIDYSTLTLKKPVVGASLFMPATSTLTTQAVHIATAANLILSGTISTKSDAISTANYRNSVNAIDESIKVYALSDGVDITLNGTLRSDNLIDIQSANNINLNGSISAKVLNVVAGNKLAHRGVSDFYNASIAADILDNNGKMVGHSLQIATKHELQNRFGGKLLADDIQLSSQYSVVRNGSQYPFKAKDDIPLILRPDAPNNIHFGTINGIPFTGASKVSDLSAYILGKTITIVAADNVENINPYFEFTLDTKLWANGIPFNQNAASQVQLVADNKLNIGSNTYVLNSSAIMGVNNPGGEFVISSPYITNERYNTKVVIQPFSETTTSGNVSSTTSGTEEALMVFSPPGIIYSFSPLGFYFTVKNGGFINNTAYFEVLSDATFTSSKTAGETEASKVTSIGLALQQNINGTTVTKTMTVAECQARAPKDEASQRACQYNPNVTNYINLTGTTDENMQGTLFSVKGNISGAASEFYGTNHRAMEEIKIEQINSFIASNSGQTGIFSLSQQSTYSSSTTLTATYSFTQQATLSADGKYIYVAQNGTRISSTGSPSSQADANFLYQQNASKTIQTITVADWVVAKFAELKAALLSALQAFQSWWNS